MPYTTMQLCFFCWAYFNCSWDAQRSDIKLVRRCGHARCRLILVYGNLSSSELVFLRTSVVAHELAEVTSIVT